MPEPETPKRGDVKVPTVLTQLHASIQQLPVEARQQDIYLKRLEAALKLIVESEDLSPVFNQLNELVPYPHPPQLSTHLDLTELQQLAPYTFTEPQSVVPYPPPSPAVSISWVCPHCGKMLNGIPCQK
jgi:hypothetical protein